MARSSALGLAVVLAAGGCISFGSGPEDTEFNRGVDAFDQKRYADAVRFFRRATEEAPEDPRPFVNLALTFDRLGKAKQAEQHYRTALRLNPEEPRALANLGQLLGERGKHAEARKLLLQATDVEPSSAYTWTALGWYAERRGKTAEAEQHYTTAIEAEPDRSTGYYHLGVLRAKQGQPEAARELLRTALANEPEDVESMRALAALLPPGGSEAIGLMERILLVVPNDAGQWLQLGRGYLAAKEPERAAMALWQARDRSAGAPERLAHVQAELRRAYALLGKALPPERPAAPGPASK
ncbi:MAG: tetratricopeptide repeat protein [Planctomycetota bacterium]|jgi:Flp pilus assembly protein TadD